MAQVIIPVRAGVPFQRLEVALEGATYVLRLDWLDRVGWWVLSVYDDDGVELLTGRRVVVNYPLLARGKNEDLPPGDLQAIDTSGRNLDPRLDDFGDGERVRLLYSDRADLEAALA